MKKSNKIVDIIIKSFKNISCINDEMLACLENYFIGENETNIIDCIPEIKFESLQNETIDLLGQAYILIKKTKNYNYLKKYVEFLFKIWHGKAGYIIFKDERLWDKYIFDDILLEAGISKYMFTAVHSYCINNKESYNKFNIHNYKIIYDILRDDRDSIIEALNYVDPENEMILKSLYCKVYDDSFKKSFIEYIETYLIDNIQNVFTSLDDKTIFLLKEFLKNNEIFEMNDDLKNKVHNSSIEEYDFKLYSSFSGINNICSIKLKKIFNVLVYRDYYTAIETLYESLIDKEEVLTNKYKFEYDNAYLIMKELDNYLKIPDRYYLCWFIDKCEYNKFSNEIIQKRFMHNKEEVLSSLSILNSENTFKLCSAALGIYKDDIFIKNLKIAAIDMLNYELKNKYKVNIEKNQLQAIEQYINNEKAFSDIYEILTSNMCLKKITYFAQNIVSGVRYNIENLKKNSDMYEKIILILAALHGEDALRSIANYQAEEFEDMFRIIDQNNISIGLQMSIIGELCDGYLSAEKYVNNIVKRLVKNHRDEVINNIKNINSSGRYIFLKCFAENKTRENVQVLLDNCGDASNIIYNFIFKQLCNEKEYYDLVLEKANSRKVKEREMAVNLLYKYGLDNNEEIFGQLLKNEKNERMKKILKSFLNIKEDDENGKLSGKSKEQICVEKAIENVKPSLLKFLNLDTLPKVKLKENGKYCEKDYLQSLITGYHYSFDYNLIVQLEEMADKLDKDDLKIFAEECFNRWIENGEESKNGCVMIFSVTYGNDDIVDRILKKIDKWSKTGRYSICGDAMRGLSLRGEKRCFIAISNLYRKSKNKGVRNSAERILNSVCSRTGMSKEQFEDLIISNLDFNKNGEQTINYGNRIFKLILNQNSQIEIYNEKGKKMKSLPAANKSDDEILVKEAKKYFKELKKELKDIFSIQTLRMTQFMINERKWNIDNWKDIFINNPVMNVFAGSLIWGVYRKKDKNYTLIHTFRYMYDGTFNDKDCNDFKISEIDNKENVIGLVYPSELKNDEIELWKIQLDDYEIVQPIIQLDRKIYKIGGDSSENISVDHFEGKLINGLSLIHKLFKTDWSRGEIGDNGSYRYLEKRDNNGYYARLEVDYLALGIENTDIAIGKLKFYKKNNFKESIKLKYVPERFYSEILYDLKNIFD